MKVDVCLKFVSPIHFEPETEVLKYCIAERQANHPTAHYRVVKLFDVSNPIV